MSIDFSPFKGQMDHMALQLAIIILVPFITALIVKWVLLSIKLPKIVANYGSVLVLLFVFYKTIMIVLN